MKNTIKENYLNNIYSLTVPTTLLDWGVPDRAYQGRSFTPPMETLGSSISPVVEYSSLPLVGNV
jgi:hypothetical protein